jgi:enamine deaminase RidA (YjgF/YER057c/UK114 family)
MAVMEKRRSIEVSGVKHVNPIPSASRRGPFVVSGAISGADPETGKVPAELDAQCRQMFDNVRRIMVAAGGDPEDIIKMNVWIADRKLRDTMNRHWVEMFPDPHSRPARHTIAHADFTAPMQIQCDLLAVIGEV